MKTLFTIFIIVTSLLHCYAQDGKEQVFEVKKPVPAASATFTYKGKHISPEALFPFLPIDFVQGDTLPISKVNLRDSIYTRSVDSISENVFRVNIMRMEDFDGYRLEVQHLISYRIIGKTSTNQFVLDIRHNTGGTFTMPYIFVFKVEGDYLVKVAMFDAEPQYLNPTIILKDDVIYTGARVYRIPK